MEKEINKISNGVNREKPEKIEGDLVDLEIREKISDVLELIRKDKDYNPEDIDEEEITSSLIDQFNSLPEDHTRKEGFLATIEPKIKIIIMKKKEAKERKKFLDTAAEIHKIDKNIPEIQKAA